MVLPFASPSPFSLGFPEPEGHLYLPPGPVLLRVLVQTRAPCGTIPWQLGLRQFLYASLIRCALRTTYVQLLSRFVGTSGGFAGLVLPLSKCLVNQDSESDRVFLGEGISFFDRESLSWAKLGHPCRDLNFRKPCPRLCGRWEVVNVRL